MAKFHLLLPSLKTIFSWAARSVALIFLLCALSSLFDFAQTGLYFLDLFSQPLLVLGIIACVFLSLGWRVFKLDLRFITGIMAASVIIYAIGLWPMRPHYSKNHKDELSLLFCNVWVRNNDPNRLVELIDHQKPDLIALIELSAHSKSVIHKKLSQNYPFFVTRHDMVIYSKFRLSQKNIGAKGHAFLSATVEAPNGPVRLSVTHLTRPWPFTHPNAQPAHFKRLTDTLKADLPLNRQILVGDFNTTARSHHLATLQKRLNLKAAEGIKGTWPTTLHGLFRLPIDHVLASEDLSILSRNIGPDIGSDHRPVSVIIGSEKIGSDWAAS